MADLHISSSAGKNAANLSKVYCSAIVEGRIKNKGGLLLYHLHNNKSNQVNVSLSLESIMKIDEVSGLFQVQFVLDMAWFDSRLKFKESFLK